MHLRCSDPACAATLELHERAMACPKCGELLEVVVGEVKASAAELKSRWLDRRLSRFLAQCRCRGTDRNAR
jgi:threonine synthase